MEKCINWHGLPCISFDDGKSAIFTNINHDLKICKLETEKLLDPQTYFEVANLGGFDCLNSTMPIQDEFTLVLSLTEKCNAACKYCFLDAQTEGKTMSKELIKETLKYIAETYPNRKINIAAFGGEPSTVPDLVRIMVAYAEEIMPERVRFSITTNGYFNDDFCDFLIEKSFHVSLSMDGIPEVQRIQRPSQFSIEQLEKNIRKIFQANKAHSKIRSTVTSYSVSHMLESVDYLSSLGVKKVHFEPVTPGGRAEKQTKFTEQATPEIFVQELKKCIEKGSQKGIDIISFPYMNMMVAPVVFCDGNVQNRLVVGASGVLSTCVEVQNRKHPLYPYLGVGFFNFEKNKFVFEYNNRRPFCRGCSSLTRTTECKNCAFNFFCAGGCPTRNYRGTQNTQEISQYRCTITKLIMPYILEKYYKATFENK